MQIPKILGDVTDQDTEFTAGLKKYQEFLFIGLCGFGLLILFVIVLSFSGGAQGTWRYAICKVFLERYVEYPPSLRILTAGEKQTSAQIGYMSTNAYGSRESELMECFYSITEDGVRLNSVTIERVPIEMEVIETFNTTIDSIIGQESLDRALPPRLPTDLNDLKQDE